MNPARYFLYLLVMAGTTYLIRVLPLAVFRRRFKSRFFRSFLYYVPYAVLTAMTFPAAFYATGSVPSALAGIAVSILLAALGQGLTTVALAACAVSFVVGLVL